MHLRANMVQRRNAQEIVLVSLAMMLLLGDCRAHQAAMLVKNSLREAGRSTGEVDDAQIIVVDGDTRVFRGEMAHAKVVAVSERRAVLTHEIQVLDLGNAIDDLFDAANEFRTENKHLDIGKPEPVVKQNSEL